MNRRQLEACAAAFYHRGTAALDRDNPERAQRSLLASLACAPYTAQSWLNLGNALMQHGDAHAALGMYRRAMSLENHPRGAVNAAIALLTLGQWEEGWKLYEQRFALPEFQIRNGLKGGDESKMWRGESLIGKTLLVFNEQGVGDTIMCLRYLDSIDHHARIVARVPSSMLRLVRASRVLPPPVTLARGTLTYQQRVEVVTDSEPLPPHDYIVPFMSLPHRIAYAQPTHSGRYLSVGDPLTERWFKFRVGIVWKGNPHHKGDKKRSMTREMFDAFDVPGVDLVSLQYGEGFRPIDFYDTAVALKGLDLLISVDTSTAHLAGALGVPTWLLLPFSADFRWGQHSETTPWYSGHKLFRQTKAGDWSSVLERVRSELATLVSTRSAA